MYKESKSFQLSKPKGDIRSPRVSYLPSGGFVVVWTEWSAGGSLQCCVYSGEGVALGEPFQVARSKVEIYAPCISYLPSGGFVVAWRQTCHSGYSLQCCVYSGDGIALGEPFQINRSSGSIFDPRVCILPSGGFVVVWTEWHDGGSIQCCVYSGDGIAVGEPFQVARSKVEIYDPCINVLPSGGFFVSWLQRDDGINSLQCRRYSYIGESE